MLGAAQAPEGQEGPLCSLRRPGWTGEVGCRAAAPTGWTDGARASMIEDVRSLDSDQ